MENGCQPGVPQVCHRCSPVQEATLSYLNPCPFHAHTHTHMGWFNFSRSHTHTHTRALTHTHTHRHLIIYLRVQGCCKCAHEMPCKVMRRGASRHAHPMICDRIHHNIHRNEYDTHTHQTRGTSVRGVPRSLPQLRSTHVII